jgi:hypothetical protein
MLAKQNTGGNAAKFFQRANRIYRNRQDFPGPRRTPKDPDGTPRTPEKPPDGGKLVLENI